MNATSIGEEGKLVDIACTQMEAVTVVAMLRMLQRVHTGTSGTHTYFVQMKY